MFVNQEKVMLSRMSSRAPNTALIARGHRRIRMAGILGCKSFKQQQIRVTASFYLDLNCIIWGEALVSY